LIGGQKNPILRDTFTPLKGCGQRQRVGGPHFMAIHKLPVPLAHPTVGSRTTHRPVPQPVAGPSSHVRFFAA